MYLNAYVTAPAKTNGCMIVKDCEKIGSGVVYGIMSQLIYYYELMYLIMAYILQRPLNTMLTKKWLKW
jgi:hypothetical protein